MKILINKNELWSLIQAPETSLENIKNNSDEVITDFTITEDQESYIKNGAVFTYSDGISITDTETERIDALLVTADKSTIIRSYSVLQKSIKEIKSDIAEAEERYDSYNDKYKALADLRLTKLNTSLTEKREEQDILTMGAVETYGSDIINEL